MNRRSLRAAVPLFLLLFAAAAAHAQPRGAVDWIFLVDTSKSMRGVGGTADIFDDVKRSIDAFIREASDGDSISVLTFDRDVRSQGLRDLHGNLDREELQAVVNSLQANGDRTHLGLAIARGLERAESLRTRGEPTRVRAVVLFTDGTEDVRGIADPVSIPSNVRRVGETFVYFVSMGEHEPQLDDFARATPRTSVLKAPTAESIQRVAQEIRAKLPQPEPPKPPIIAIAPAAIEFGDVTVGEATEPREVTITSDKPARLSVHLSPSPGVTMTPRDDVAVAPNAPAKVTLRLDAAPDAIPGRKQLTLQAVTAGGARAESTVTLGVVAPSPLLRAAKWLAAIAALLLVAFAAFTINRRKNRLEGEIEILQPRVAPDAACVGLPRLETNEVALSAIVPAEALAGSDARLFVRRRNGTKKVWIAANSGSLRINDVETPLTELYDADTIQLGDAKLRFNRVGDERPPENEFVQ